MVLTAVREEQGANIVSIKEHGGQPGVQYRTLSASSRRPMAYNSPIVL